MIAQLRCLSCGTMIEEDLVELHVRLDDAAEAARRRNSDRVVLMCPGCTTRHFPEFIKVGAK